jgi:hypothetical protein
MAVLTALIIAIPYIAILLIAWDRRQTGMGVVLAILLALVELMVAGHLWLAVRL